MKTDASNGCSTCGSSIPANAPQGLCPHCVLARVATAQDSGGSGGVPPVTSELPLLERVRAAFAHLEVLEMIGRVDLRELADGRWLIMDLAHEVRGDCEPLLRVDGYGFEARTRRSQIEAPAAGSPSLAQQRIE